MMKIAQIATNTYQCKDLRGEFTVHNNIVIELRDNNGVLHLPIDTPDEAMRMDKAVYDLDTTTGHPIKMGFVAKYCKNTAHNNILNNFKQLSDTWFVFTDWNELEGESEYSLRSGVTVKSFLIFVIKHTFQIDFYEAYKIAREDHFKDRSWRDLSFKDVYNMWVEYKNDIDIRDFKRSVINGYALLKEEHPLRNFIRPNFQIYEVDHYRIIVLDVLLEKFSFGFDFTETFTELMYKLPVIGRLVIGENEYKVEDFLNNQYHWDVDEFINNFFKTHRFNTSIRNKFIEVLRSEYEELES